MQPSAGGADEARKDNRKVGWSPVGSGTEAVKTESMYAAEEWCREGKEKSVGSEDISGAMNRRREEITRFHILAQLSDHAT